VGGVGLGVVWLGGGGWWGGGGGGGGGGGEWGGGGRVCVVGDTLGESSRIGIL